MVTAAFPSKGVIAYDGLLDDHGGLNQAEGQEVKAADPESCIQEELSDSSEIVTEAEETLPVETESITEVETEVQTEVQTEIQTETELESETETENPELLSKCTHQHDVVCGYVEAALGVFCNMGCKETDTNGSVIHCYGCAYQPETEGMICTHVHDGECGYYDSDESEVMTETETQSETETETKTEPETVVEADTEADIETEIETETVLVTEPETEIESETKSVSGNGMVTDSEAAGSKESNTESQSQSAKDTDTEPQTGQGIETENKAVSSKPIQPEMQKETESLGTTEDITETVEKIEIKDLAERKNAPSFTVSIPAEVMINANTDFEIETAYLSRDEVAEEGEMAYLVIDGDKKECLDDYFVLTREGDDSITWQYQLYVEDALITGANNKVALNGKQTKRKATIHLVEQQAVLPAGSYKGTLNFRIVYEDEKAAGTLN